MTAISANDIALRIERIRHAKDQRGCTWTWLALNTGYSRAHITGVMRGIFPPAEKCLMAMEAALDIRQEKGA